MALGVPRSLQGLSKFAKLGCLLNLLSLLKRVNVTTALLLPIKVSFTFGILAEPRSAQAMLGVVGVPSAT